MSGDENCSAKKTLPLKRFIRCIACSLENWYNLKRILLSSLIVPLEMYHGHLFADRMKRDAIAEQTVIIHRCYPKKN